MRAEAGLQVPPRTHRCRHRAVLQDNWTFEALMERSGLGAERVRARRPRFASATRVASEAAEAAIPEVPPTPATLRRNARYRRGLALADACAAGMSLVLAVSVVGGLQLRPTVVLAAPLLVLVSKIVGLYDRDADVLHRTTLDEAPALFHVATLSTLLAWLGDEYYVFGKLNGSQILVVWGLLMVAMLCTRAGARCTRARGDAARPTARRSCA